MPSHPARSVSSRGVFPTGVATADPWLRLGAHFLEVVLIFVTLGIGWLIWAATLAGEGQTPAKKLLGLHVIGADTMRPVGFSTMFWMRGLVAGIVAYFALGCTLYIIAFMPFWDRNNQNIWDKVTNTFVVTDPHSVLAAG
jgi:uncharacterized RDD family membrane protein YckC